MSKIKEKNEIKKAVFQILQEKETKKYLIELLENIGFANAMKQGLKTKSVSEDEILKTLEG